MLSIEARKRVQDKLILLTAAELAAVDARIDEMLAERRRHAEGR